MFILLVIVFMLLFSVAFESDVFDILNAKYRRIINKSTFCVCARSSRNTFYDHTMSPLHR